MALTLTKENYFWHKVHSLTGVIPVGFYMVQHLTLNSFSLMGEDKFDGVIGFFDSLPKHVLLATEILVIWLPLLFHAVYGIFIGSRSKSNYFTEKYGWKENGMFFYQRISGYFIFIFLCFHVFTTTAVTKASGDTHLIRFAAWHDKFMGPVGVLQFIFYMLGIAACSYHLCYGLWNFCIRWGITISETSQKSVQKFSGILFVVVLLLGWSALLGFIIHTPSSSTALPASVVPDQETAMSPVTRIRYWADQVA